MNETINNFKPFDTIAGINQIEEIENYILPETIIITMDDIWSLYKKRFPKNIDVYFVNTLEENELEREVSKFKNYKMIIQQLQKKSTTQTTKHNMPVQKLRDFVALLP